MNDSIMFGAAVTPQATTPSKTSPRPTGQVHAVRRGVASQLKLFVPCGAATWLFAELDYDDVVFGLCDPR